MSLGDVFQRGSGGWGAKAGNLRGHGAASAFVPKYAADSPVPYDSHTLAHFRFNETGPVDLTGVIKFMNEVTGNYDLFTDTGTPHIGGIGPFGERAGTGYAGSIKLLGNTENVRLIITASGMEPVNYLTLSVWVFLHTYQRGDGRIITKPYAPVSWPYPYQVVAFGFDPLKFFYGGVNTAALLSDTHSATIDSYGIPLREWVLLSLTYDGAYERIYLNGVEEASFANTGPITWSTGSYASPWVLGIPRGLSGEGLDLRYGPLWIEDIARPASYLRRLYQLGAKRF